MSDRVALGTLGSGAYGLRVSKPGFNAVSGSTLVPLANLLFDTVYPVANMAIYGIWDIQVTHGTTRTITHSSPALGYIPFGIGYWRATTNNLYGEFWTVETGIAGTPPARPPEAGFTWEVSTSQIRVENHNPGAGSAWFRIVLFQVDTA